ncbi:MAG: tRNA (N(6)-L-threonylcarbamoyladenosine(37)-C(2))-methylthiotransferase MtaB [Chloroflexota bacterium]
MNVFLDTIGCRLNQSEIETYARQFTAAGHVLVSSPSDADLVVINTCSVTAAAASDSRQKIRQAKKAGVEQIVVTGCMSTLAPEEAAKMPGVTAVIPNKTKDTLVPDLLQIEINEFDLEPIARQPVPGSRMRTRAFIKVQDGCDNRCTFCVTTLARGDGRSRSIEQVTADVLAAARSGVQEAVLTGVHLGSWGYDFSTPAHLADLVRHLLKQTEIPRLRISSLEPWDLTAEFFSLWENSRLCRHLHLPLQSGSASVLRRMARKTTPEAYQELVTAARAHIPGVAITTDLIVGFPGETEQEFEENVDFVKELDFAGLHVFTYSPRPGTAAEKMPHQVHNFTRKERSAQLRKIGDQAAQSFWRSYLEKEVEVLWESMRPSGNPGEWQLSGLTDNYLKVHTTASQPIWNQVTPTKLISIENHSLRGEILQYPDTISISGS